MEENEVEDILLLQKSLKEKKSNQMKIDIQKESILEKLKNEFGCDTIEKAKDLLDKKQNDFNKINIKEKIDEFKREFNLWNSVQWD